MSRTIRAVLSPLFRSFRIPLLLLVSSSSCSVIDVVPAGKSGDAGPDGATNLPGASGCASGAPRCQGSVLQFCEADGSGWRSQQRCASPALCVASASEVSRCIDPQCEPGITCAGAILQQCNVDLNGYDALDACVSAAHCDSSRGICQAAPCTAGEISCNGATLRRCSATPIGHDEIATCATAALCDDLVRLTCGNDLVGCDTAGATCPTPACAVGQLRCAGARLELCNAGRNGWDFVDNCVTPGVCELTLTNPVAVSCIEPPCGPGDTLCSPAGAILGCNTEQTAYSVPVTQCRSAAVCTPQGCDTDPCTLGASSCNVKTLQVCRELADGTFGRVTEAECDTQQLCQDSVSRGPVVPQTCVAPECAAGELRCAGRQMQVCNAGRTDFVNHELCDTDSLCAAGLSEGHCLACSPVGSSRCNGAQVLSCSTQNTESVTQTCASADLCQSTGPTSVACASSGCTGQFQCTQAGEVLVCNSGLTGYVQQNPRVFCATAQLCNVNDPDGCLPPACAVAERQCVGQTVQICNSGRTAFEPLETCGAGFTCQGSGGLAACACTPGSYRCVGEGLQKCNGAGTTFVDVATDLECNAATRVSCSGTTVVQNACATADHCAASNGAVCAQCVAPAECNDGNACNGVETCNPSTDTCASGDPLVCADDTLACNGTESCSPASGCQSSGNPCTSPGLQVCSESAPGNCVQCVLDTDCQPPGQVCGPGNVCGAPPG